MNYKDIRWKQRFENYSKALFMLERTLTINSPSEVERAGIIQFYEISFELGWKVLKDYLESEGFMVKSPRECIKTAFQNEYITDGALWLQALEDRNIIVHTYNESIANEVYETIKSRYYNLLKQLYDFLLPLAQ